MKNSADVELDQIAPETHGVMLTRLALGMSSGNVAPFFSYIAKGANPNNAMGGVSLIAFTMEKCLRAHERGANTDEQFMLQQTCAALLHYGADLAHRPLDHNNRPAALHAPDLWRRPRFGAQVMLRAMSAALERDLPLPRLDAAALDNRALDDANREKAAEHIRWAHNNISLVQQEVGRELQTPTTEHGMIVSARIAPADRDFWLEKAHVSAQAHMLSASRYGYGS